MSKFTDYIDGLAEQTSTLAKEELKELIISAKKDESEFVRLQADNLERWTIMLAAGELTPAGFKKKVSKLDVLTKRPCEERSDAAIPSWKSRLKPVLNVLQTAFKSI